MKKILLLVGVMMIVGSSVFSQTDADFYWRGNSDNSDYIDQNDNWSTDSHPSSGDNLYFDNTTGSKHWAQSNYGSGSWFGNIIVTDNNAGSIKWYGDETFAYKFENQTSNLFTISSNIGSRLDSDLEVNPVGSGDILVEANISVTNNKWLKVYGDNILTIEGDITLSGDASTGGVFYLTEHGPTVIFNTISKTYAQRTILEEGTLELHVSTANSDFTINDGASLMIKENATVKSISVENGGTVEIAPGKTLTVTNNFSNSGTVTIKSTADGTGSLIVGGISTGNVTVQRYLSPNIYHYISAPVATGAMDAGDFGLTCTNAYDAFYSFDETSTAGVGEWIDLLRPSSGAMSVTPEDARGYAYCAGGASSGIGTAQTVNFTGTVRDAVSYAATYTALGAEGNNLIGNPYPSTVAVNDDASETDWLLNGHGIGEIYIWDEVTTNDYKTVSNSSGATFIQAGQAFMTTVSSASTINLTRAVCNATAGSFYKAATAANRLYLNVNCDNGNSNQTMVAFQEGMTDGFDYSYDAEKLKGNPQIALYTKMADGTAGDYAIQALDASRLADAKVWVGLDARTDAPQLDVVYEEYTFSIGNPDEFIGEVFLEDIKEGAFHNLKESNYVTSVARGYHTDRFVLHFREEGGKMTTGVCQNPEACSFKVFASSGSIYTIDATGEVEVFDLAGRRVAVATMNESTNCVARNLNPGAYIVRTAAGTEKVIVQ